MLSTYENIENETYIQEFGPELRICLPAELGPQCFTKISELTQCYFVKLIHLKLIRGDVAG